MILTLRNYQTKLISLIKKSLKKGFKKIVAVAPTRSGKTVVFSYLAEKIENAGGRTLILTHREEIFEQTIKKLCEFGLHPGQIRSNRTITKNLTQVGMVMTVRNSIKKQERIKKQFHKLKNFTIIEEPDVIIIDEVHHATSKTFNFVIQYFPDATIIGFTATPERLDGSGLIGAGFQSLVIGKSTKWMIDNYWLSKPIHLCPPSPLDKAKLKSRGGDYTPESMADIMKKHVVCDDVVKCYREFFNGAPVIVFCCTIDHAEKMTEAYKRDGWKAVVIHGKLTRKERDNAMNGFRDGKYQILISVDLIGEGVDVPVCAGVQLLRKTKSLGLYLQMSARGLTPIYADGYNLENINDRKKALQDGKPESIILDHAGNYWTHGKIDKERNWSIDHKKRDNKKIVEIKKVTCPACKFSWQIGTKKCPHCGYDFEAHAKRKKEFEQVELKEKLININDIEEMQADSLSKVILRIKEYPKPSSRKGAVTAIMHTSVKYGETGLKKKIAAMCEGLGYDKHYKHRVWRHLREQYGERLDRLA